MRVECALSPIHLRRWVGSGLKLDHIIIHDLRKVTPTMRFLAWLVACVISLFSVLLLERRWEKKACFLMAEKSGTVR